MITCQKEKLLLLIFVQDNTFGMTSISRVLNVFREHTFQRQTSVLEMHCKHSLRLESKVRLVKLNLNCARGENLACYFFSVLLFDSRPCTRRGLLLILFLEQ